MSASEDREIRRKRLSFRAWHRGTKEMDLILGRFADAHLAGFDDAELDAFERVSALPDIELYKWLTEREPVPAAQDSPMFRRVKATCALNAEKL